MNLNQQLLIALPDMQDDRFKNAVILICEHNEDGAMGLVLNQPLAIDTDHVFMDLNLNNPKTNQIVLNGGPLKKNRGFVLHNDNKTYKSSIRIKNNLTLTTSKDLLEKIASQNFVIPWRFILGFASWGKDQLESEIAENSWLTCPVDLDLIFDTDLDNKWQKALALIGINDYQNISGIGHA